MFKLMILRSLLCWTRKRIKRWDDERAKTKFLSQIYYSEGRVDSYKDMERILEILINENK